VTVEIEVWVSDYGNPIKVGEFTSGEVFRLIDLVGERVRYELTIYSFGTEGPE
jgi:hypothetical protein